MPIPTGITRVPRRILNPHVLRFAGRVGSLADLEHVGRRSGSVRHTPILAFRRGATVTIALTYGPDVQWLANVRSAGRCRLLLRGKLLTLGAPRMLDAAEGLRRMPQPERAVLRWPVRCRDFVELPIVVASQHRPTGAPEASWVWAHTRYTSRRWSTFTTVTTTWPSSIT